jgi:hypothetical protein
MNTKTQQEMMNHINQTLIATTDKANTKYQIELLIQHLTEIVTDVDIRSMFVPDSKIGDVGAIALVEILKHNTTIELVVLEGIDNTEKGAMALTNIWDMVWEEEEENPHKNCFGCACCIPE